MKLMSLTILIKAISLFYYLTSLVIAYCYRCPKFFFIIEKGLFAREKKEQFEKKNKIKDNFMYLL